MSQSQDSQAPDAAEIVIEHVPGFFKVHIDGSSLDVCYKLLGDKELSKEQRAFISRAKLMGAAPTPYLASNYQLAFKRTVGEAMALAIRDDLPSAKDLLDSAEKFLADRTGETARMWYVQATVMLLVLLFALFALISMYYSPQNDLPQNGSASIATTKGKPAVTEVTIKASTPYKLLLYSLAMLGGALGAGFSLLVRVADLKIDPAAGWRAHYGEVAFRLTIGGLAALIILFGMEADVFAGFLKVSSESGLIDAELYARTFWIIGVFSILAGASERLVPSLLEQLSDRTISDSGKTNEDKTPPGK